MTWVSPLPSGVAHAVKVFRPRHDLRRAAEWICDRAWKGQGVRVWRWPCGTLAVTTVASLGDGVLLRECEAQLLVTYARHGLLAGGVPGPGPLWVDVLHDLNWARAAG